MGEGCAEGGAGAGGGGGEDYRLCEFGEGVMGGLGEGVGAPWERG